MKRLQLFAEELKSMLIATTMAMLVLEPEWKTNVIQRISFLNRDTVFSSSGSQWLKMLEKNRVFNRNAFDLLERCRQVSTCPEEKVSALIYGFANGMIDLLSIGINGCFTGHTDQPLYIHKRGCVHAEPCALILLPAISWRYDLVCYTSLAPCLACAERLYEAGVKAVSYIEEYRDRAGKEFLLNKGIPVCKLKLTGEMVPLDPDLCLQPFQPHVNMSYLEVWMRTAQSVIMD